MIKVNLLKDQTARTRKTFVKPKVSRTGLIFAVLLLAAAGVMGGWAFTVNHQISVDTVRREELRREVARLELLKKEVEKYEKLKAQRQSRIDVIETLKDKQSGPVLLLNTVIQSIPRDGDLWLTSLSQKSGIIKVVGSTAAPNVIPQLMSNLKASGIFASVDLELIERQEDSSKFSLICTSVKQPQAE
jgi:Tfp pilus assembly protein PilN